MSLIDRLLKSQKASHFGALLFCLLGASCLPSEAAAQTTGKSIYAALPQDKPLQTSSQFISVEDFNHGKYSGKDGKPWQIKSPIEGALDLSIVKEDARNPARGYSLKSVMNMAPGERVSFQAFLDLLDVSQTDYFVFKLKLKLKKPGAFQGKMFVTFSDWKHQKATFEFTDQLENHPNNEWFEIVVPVKALENIDKDALFMMRFLIASGEFSHKGELWIDEVAFFGGSEAGFESNRDNLEGFPEHMFDDGRREKILKMRSDEKRLRAIAEDTFEYFNNARDKKTQLIVDHIRVGDSPLAASYTSPTNIAMDILSTIGAWKMKMIKKSEAVARLDAVLQTAEKMSKYHGFLYNFYDTKTLSITRPYISSVDNGWWGISLVVLRQAFAEEFESRASALLDAMDFEEFLDPENNQLIIGYDVPKKDEKSYHYGMLVSEARATSLLAIGKGDIEKEHWWFLFRTPPVSWDWQNQTPKGTWVDAGGVDYFQGHYEKKGVPFVPSWGGSLFEYLMPTLILKEKELAPRGLGANNRTAAKMHRDYALTQKGYPIWGISPSATTNGRQWSYGEYGIKGLSVKGYPDKGILTPHVGFLALDPLPEEALENIIRWLEYRTYGEYGFYDTLDAKKMEINPQYLALDQGMIFVAITNFLTKGSIQSYFHEDSVGKSIEDLIMKESFFTQ